MPQGSILGPTLFTLHSGTANTRKYGLTVQFHTDDSQLYTAFGPGDAEITVAKVDRCVAEIGTWLLAHRLNLSGDNSVITQIPPHRNSVEPYSGRIVVGDSKIVPSGIAQNLRTALGQHLNMKAPVKRIRRSSYLELCKLSQINSMLTQDPVEKQVHASITRRTDYCNFLLYGLPTTVTSQL